MIKNRKTYAKDWSNPENRGEYNPFPSVTVPDGVLSIRQLIERHTRGQSLPIRNDLYYDEDINPNFDVPDISNMDNIQKALLKQNIDDWIDQQLELHNTGQETEDSKKKNANKEANVQGESGEQAPDQQA